MFLLWGEPDPHAGGRGRRREPVAGGGGYLGAGKEGFVLEIERLLAVDGGIASGVDDHVAGLGDAPFAVLLGTGQTQAFVRREQVALDFLLCAADVGQVLLAFVNILATFQNNGAQT